MSARVMLTGAGGFIGRHLRASLEAEGYEVICLTRAEADVTDRDGLLARAVPADALVHLAFPASPRARRMRPLDALVEAAAGTANSLALAEACGARHVLLASSGKVYGAPCDLPVTEKHPTLPDTFLGELKLLQEAIVRVGARRGGRFGASLLRLFNVYGPGQSKEYLVPTLLGAWRDSGDCGPVRLGELDHRRDWIHVTDACAAFAAAVALPAEVGRVRELNAGTGRSASVREILEMLTSISGTSPDVKQEPSLLRPEEAAEERADCRRMQDLGWRPRVSLEQGLESYMSLE